MTLTITFPDGAKKNLQLASQQKKLLKESLKFSEKALAGKVNGQLIDLDRGLKRMHKSKSSHRIMRML